MKPGGKRNHALRPTLIAVSVAAAFSFSSPASANPTDPTVISGSASFAAAGNALSVTNSANAVIHWQGFSIGINEITRFLQPSAASAVLNRVVGGDVSSILGALESNGRVFLINPNGIVFGAAARIDVAGLVASSLNLSDQDFLEGRMRFTEVPGAGGIANHGVIETAAGGRVFLIAPSVENSGIISAPQGEIVLAAGKSAELVSEASPYLMVRIEADAGQALNVGSLIAESGRIGMFGALVRHSGVAEASGAQVGPGGEIRFVASKDLTLEAGSRVAANGTSGGSVLLRSEGGTNLIAGTVEATGESGKGGSVQALGVRVGVIGEGVIDASGETGGGAVLVGGDFQGANPDIQNAERTYIGADGVIRADARTTGDGGRVIVWADGDTRFHGSISARGGAESGNGGFVETSGKQHLTFNGQVDTRAPNGVVGQLLLDPTNIEIHDGPGDGDDADINFPYGSFFDGGLPTTGTSIIFEPELEGTAATTQVFVQADNGITFKPLTTDGELFLAYGGFFSAQPGSGGIVMEDQTNRITSAYGPLSFASYGSITLGDLKTNGGPVDIGISAGGAGDIKTRSITTSTLDATSGGGGSVSIHVIEGVIVVDGTIDTRGTAGSGDGYGGSWGGSVSISRSGTGIPEDGVGIRVTGQILTMGGNGAAGTTASGGGGASGGSINIVDNGANSGVVIEGDIDTGGANGASGAASASAFYGGWGGEGGWGGDVRIYAPKVTVASITTRGGNGGNGGSSTSSGESAWLDVSGGSGGNGGDIEIDAYSGALLVSGVLDSRGGNGGNGGNGSVSGAVGYSAYARGGDGGEGGRVDLFASGTITAQDILTRGGNGGRGGSASITTDSPESFVSAYADASGGDGYYGGNVRVDAGDHVSLGSIDAQGGVGGHGGSASITVSNVTEPDGPIVDVSVNAHADGGWGGDGGIIEILSALPLSVSVGSVLAYGGAGAAAGSASISVSGSPLSVSAWVSAIGGTGGAGAAGAGFFEAPLVGLSSAGPISAGTIDASGANGGAGGDASVVIDVATGTVDSSAGADGGDGGTGAPISVFSSSLESSSLGNVFARGGAGAGGGTAAISVKGTPLSAIASAFASGGDGGDGASGVEGEVIQLSASAGAFNLTGAIDASGGAGGVGGTTKVDASLAYGSLIASADSLAGVGGSGGGIDIFAGSITAAQGITTKGASGGAGGTATLNISATGAVDAFAGSEGESGGDGGQISLSATGAVAVRDLDVSGASGGAGGASSVSIDGSPTTLDSTTHADGGSGGWAGSIFAGGGTVSTLALTAFGGGAEIGGTATQTINGGALLVLESTAGGADGGGGGAITLDASGGDVSVGDVINARGGTGSIGGTSSVGVTTTGAVSAALDEIGAAGGMGAAGGSVAISSSYGGSITTQAIQVWGGDGGSGRSASLAVGGSPLDVSSYVYANAGGGGFGGGVSVNSGAGISVSSIDARGGASGSGGVTSASASDATGIVGLTADASGNFGGAGGAVQLSAGTQLAVPGSIVTAGGNGGGGGSASLTVTGTPIETSLDAYGWGALGGSGGQVGLGALGAVAVGAIDTRGGQGGNGQSASITVEQLTGALSPFAFATADGGSSLFGFGSLPSGGQVSITAGGSIAAASIATLSGNGGNGGTASISIGSGVPLAVAEATAYGGHAGFVGLVSLTSSAGDIVVGPIDQRLGNGGNGGSASINGTGTFNAFVAADGGTSGFVGGGGVIVIGEVQILQTCSLCLTADASVVTGAINAFGGNGGNGGTASSGSTASELSTAGGFGGVGGFVQMTAANGSISTGRIDVRGGAGGAGSAGGGGGFGGEVLLRALNGSITVGTPALPGLFAFVIDAAGGAGGAGGPASSPAGSGGDGGDGGSVSLGAPEMTINGIIVADGGAGGAGGAASATEPTPGVAGSGGDGGSLSMSTPLGTGTITFVNGGWSLLGGTGSTAGIDGAIDLSDVVFPEGGSAAQLIWPGPEDTSFLSASGLFTLIALNDPLSNPKVLQAVGTIFEETTEAAGGDLAGGESESEEERDKKGFGSCRP